MFFFFFRTLVHYIAFEPIGAKTYWLIVFFFFRLSNGLTWGNWRCCFIITDSELKSLSMFWKTAKHAYKTSMATQKNTILGVSKNGAIKKQKKKMKIGLKFASGCRCFCLFISFTWIHFVEIRLAKINKTWSALSHAHHMLIHNLSDKRNTHWKTHTHTEVIFYRWYIPMIIIYVTQQVSHTISPNRGIFPLNFSLEMSAKERWNWVNCKSLLVSFFFLSLFLTSICYRWYALYTAKM